VITLSAVGDIILSGKVTVDPDRADVLFDDVRHLLSGTDVAIGNLEGPLSARGEPFVPGKEFNFRASPGYAACLSRAGIDIVSLANNHILDYGVVGLYDTMDALAGHGIAYVGAGKDFDQACKPLVRVVEGVKLGFLAFTYAFPARTRRPGCCPCDLDLIRRLVSSLRQSVDVVVVSIHDGIEYVDYPTRYMMSLCRGAAEAGATVVLGHHPHVVQGLERHNDALIAYSLGNFVSDFADEEVRRESYQRTALAHFGRPVGIDDLRTTEAFILECDLDVRGLVDYRLLPVRSRSDFSVVEMNEAESRVFLNRVKSISDTLGREDDPIFDEMDALLEKCKVAGLQAVQWRDVLRRSLDLRPRHLRLAWPYLRAKLRRA